MLLQSDAAWKLTTTDAAAVLTGSSGEAGDATAMYGHVRLEVALGREGSPAQSTAVRTLTGVCAVVHQQSATAAQYTVTYDTLVRVRRCAVVTGSAAPAAAVCCRLTHQLLDACRVCLLNLHVLL